MRRFVQLKLPVRIWGMDADGKPFSLLAHTVEVAPDSARLEGVRAQVRVNEVVGLQCRERKSRFRVAAAEPSPNGCALRVEATEPLSSFWGIDLDSLPESAPAAPARIERRRHKRYEICGTVEVKVGAADIGAACRLAEVSMGGCFIESFAPCPIASTLGLRLHIDGVEVNAAGLVRVHHPGFGMGVEFTGFASPQDQVRLAELIDRLEHGLPAPPALPAPAAAESDQQMNALLAAVARELTAVEDALKLSRVDPGVLRQFRAALSLARNTAWDLQRWIELEHGMADPVAMLYFINRERVRSATELCSSIAADIAQLGITLRPDEADQLIQAVEEVFHQLSAAAHKEPVKIA